MRFFLDTANVEHIKEANEMGVICGVTTNPSLVAKEGYKDFKDLLTKICSIVKGDVSAEVLSTDCDGIVKEARELVKIADNIVIKVPLIKEGLKAVKILSSENIKTNVTLCFSPSQAVLAAKAGAYIISPFVGRLDDISYNGMELIDKITRIYSIYGFTTQVLVASVRHPMHFVEACEMGADICTMPFKVINQLVKHPLTDIGLENFLKDWNKLQNS